VYECAKRQQERKKKKENSEKSTYFLMTSLKTLLLRAFVVVARSRSLLRVCLPVSECVCARVARCAGNLLKSRSRQENLYSQQIGAEARHSPKTSDGIRIASRKGFLFIWENHTEHTRTQRPAANRCDKLAARTHTTPALLPLSLYLTRSRCLLLSLLTFFFLFAALNRDFGANRPGICGFCTGTNAFSTVNAIAGSDLLINSVFFAQKSFADYSVTVPAG